jgi:dTDP-glucose 4,6-dehydratase
MTIFITGARGFIGSELWRQLARETSDKLIGIDKGTYAAVQTPEELCAIRSNLEVLDVDICDQTAIQNLFDKEQPHTIYHLAAESHVDRSIDGPEAFVQTNTVGTFRLLEAARTYWNTLDETKKQAFRFIQISTDEVYGSLDTTAPSAKEDNPFQPNSPYSASKAAGDHFARSYYETYGLPVIRTHGSNTYGPYQFPEKLIPVVINKALSGQPIPIYGDGKQKREWLHVSDHAKGIHYAATKGIPGESYNIGSGEEYENNTLVNLLLKALAGLQNQDLSTYTNLIEHVTDRPGHDRRYALNVAKLKALGWKIEHNLEQGLKETVNWYLDHQDWSERIHKERYDGRRLGAIA